MEAIKARVREMEAEAEKLKEMQNDVEKQMALSPPAGRHTLSYVFKRLKIAGYLACGTGIWFSVIETIFSLTCDFQSSNIAQQIAVQSCLYFFNLAIQVQR